MTREKVRAFGTQVLVPGTRTLLQGTRYGYLVPIYPVPGTGTGTGTRNQEKPAINSSTALTSNAKFEV